MTMKFPFTENTLGKKLEAGAGLSVTCLTCRRTAVLDVAALVERLGPDHGCLHWDLVKVIFCHECRAAGRDDRNLQFTKPCSDAGKAEGVDALPIGTQRAAKF
ncbi:MULTISPECIES: hypothetical protein [Mesorhizobium]|uniref:Uncharacterized protein n=1 Tax=Mesorhizobium shonense TaxID=1209948 RepID=A0ABV2I041_9HYPH|nr:hypothetical protein [Mesorhizobium sp.]RWA84390.1 MAG: hypothetical protein EOQ30_08660 [Mesorhizobium sp.]